MILSKTKARTDEFGLECEGSSLNEGKGAIRKDKMEAFKKDKEGVVRKDRKRTVQRDEKGTVRINKKKRVGKDEEGAV